MIHTVHFNDVNATSEVTLGQLLVRVLRTTTVLRAKEAASDRVCGEGESSGVNYSVNSFGHLRIPHIVMRTLDHFYVDSMTEARVVGDCFFARDPQVGSFDWIMTTGRERARASTVSRSNSAV